MQKGGRVYAKRERGEGGKRGGKVPFPFSHTQLHLSSFLHPFHYGTRLAKLLENCIGPGELEADAKDARPDSGVKERLFCSALRRFRGKESRENCFFSRHVEQRDRQAKKESCNKQPSGSFDRRSLNGLLSSNHQTPVSLPPPIRGNKGERQKDVLYSNTAPLKKKSMGKNRTSQL